jgi:hypothetical protein
MKISTLITSSVLALICTANASAAITDGVPAIEAGQQTVFYNKVSTDGWDGNDIYAYAWNSTTTYTAAWAGTQAPYIGSPGTNSWMFQWTYTGSETVSGNIIFNNNNDKQTADLTFANGGIYNSSGLVKTLVPNTGTGMSEKVYFYPTTWTASNLFVYIYYIDDNNKPVVLKRDWPGIQLAKDDAFSDLYSAQIGIDVPEGKTAYMVFNEGGSTTKKTSDIALSAQSYKNFYDETGKDVPTGVNNVSAQAVAISAMPGAVSITGAKSSTVYDTVGHMVATLAGDGTISLNAGFYIVKADSKTSKIMVK